MPEGRAPRSTDITPLPHYYGPVLLPIQAAVLIDDVRVANSTRRGLPPLTTNSLYRHAAPTTPANQTGAGVGRFPVCAAFPTSASGRRPRFHFRGLLGHTARYGLTACSPGQAGLCHEASARPLPAFATRQLRCRPTSSSAGPFTPQGVRSGSASNFPEGRKPLI